jgi:hypothetical protein
MDATPTLYNVSFVMIWHPPSWVGPFRGALMAFLRVNANPYS